MNARLAVRVYGTPIPQGSKVANFHGHGVRDANAAKLKPWRAALANAAKDQLRYTDQLLGPVRVWVRFTFDRPRSHYGTGRNAHILRATAPLFPGHGCGDLDKLQRAVFDALTDAKAWRDDAQAVDVRARKFYAGDDEHALDRAGVDVILEDLTPHPVPAATPTPTAGTAHPVQTGALW